MNNQGNSYTGISNLRGNFYVNNPWRLGDLFTLNLLTTGQGMNYRRVAYESITSGSGTKVGGSVSGLRYAIGGSLTNLLSSGAANVNSLWIKQPLQRNRQNSIYVQMEIARSLLKDHMESGSVPTYTDRNIKSNTFSAYGEFHDTLWRYSLNTWNLSVTRGLVQFDNASALAVDKSASNTAGLFTKYNLAIQRIETISNFTALHLAINMQKTSSNLDSSQKMDVGGPASVRAYLAGISSGDSGYLASMELRHTMGLALQTHWTASLFTDVAGVRTNPSYSARASSPVVIKDLGTGLLWSSPLQWSGAAYIAWPLGDLPSGVSSYKPARIYVVVQKGF
jgi:hemolysin activation/secretion protein